MKFPFQVHAILFVNKIDKNLKTSSGADESATGARFDSKRDREKYASRVLQENKMDKKFTNFGQRKLWENFNECEGLILDSS